MAKQTDPPGHPVVIFDGDCAFCRHRSADLKRWLPDSDVEHLSFRDEGVLGRFPGLTAEACERSMQYVDAGGGIYAGLDGITRLLALRRAGKATLIYRIPGIRHIGDRVYDLIARNRFRLVREHACTPDACGPAASAQHHEQQEGDGDQ